MKKDAYEQYWEWASKPPESDLSIPASIYNAVMQLSGEDQQDRRKVNAAVRRSRWQAICRGRNEDIYDTAEWTEAAIDDLKASLEHGSTIEEAAGFLCRSGNIQDVERKARELGLPIRGQPR
ncbi:hypothetical protein I6F35_33785 [Bradyrhizobium sp. BRP22]|uniref:hypothetical protein n=1 Tax=Bradyrhizobium sp. BRP22 TaxID=2793821 RepID=UPI001CD2ECB5|nr:hypothetical protein [Bradyrhizobium sp. BRP22]MCA1458108.1 hypothetical protein [Bradyrhizobium sp. BRP22]